MKKPSAYLPFYGNDFFESIAGYPDGVGLGYLRALWHYWNLTNCEGLPDDDDYLRRVCCCDIADWGSTFAANAAPVKYASAASASVSKRSNSDRSGPASSPRASNAAIRSPTGRSMSSPKSCSAAK